AAGACFAPFSHWSIDKGGTGSFPTRRSSDLATSAAFNITAGTATQLVFSVEPSTTAAGAAITPAVQVTAQDGQGNTATGFTGNVKGAIGRQQCSRAQRGTVTLAAVAGVATFA